MTSLPWNRINTGLLLLVLLSVIGLFASRAYGGPLDPPGPPSSTLPQVEPRSPIPPVGWDGASAITIGSSGSYFLTRNLTQVPITIAAENVTFDLSGFTLTGSSGQNAIAILTGTKHNIVVRNGTLIGAGGSVGVTASGVGRSTFSDLQISGWTIGLVIGTGNTVLRVDSHDNTSEGIRVQNSADFGGSIEDSNFSQNPIGVELLGNNVTVRDSVMDANSSDGVAMSGSWNEVTNSRMVGNGIYGATMTGNRNVLVNNQIDGNVTAPFFLSGSGNIAGPISPATGTNPAENIGFP
jgi:hypothetical protein